MSLTIQRLSYKRIGEIADQFLSQYHPGLSPPIPIEEIAEQKLRLKIREQINLKKNYDVDGFLLSDLTTIFIDLDLYIKFENRTRFTAAEEVGHIFLHKDWYVKNGPKGLENYLQWQQTVDGRLFDYIERQAKTFASMVLMPETKVLEQWNDFVKHSNLPGVCKVFDLPDTFPELAREFLVSPDSLLVRLSHLKLVQIPDGF